MLQDAHERKISIPLTVTGPGDTSVVTSVPGTWLYIHELIGDFNNDDTLTVKAGSRVLATFNLAANQGITEDDEPGEDNRPRFECKPGEDFILNIAGSATFTGALHYSFRY